MPSVMAKIYEVFGRYVVDVNLSVELKNGDDWLRYGCKYMRLFLGRDSGSRLAMEVGDGARHWRVFWALLELLKKLKAPVVAGAFGVRVLTH